MSDAPLTPPTNGQATPPTPEALPPYVHVVMIDTGSLVVKTNLTDKLLVLSLLEGAKFSIMQPQKPALHLPSGHGFAESLRRRMAR